MRPILLAIAALITLQLAACNTISGMGKDLQRGGQEIQNAAGH